MGWWDTIVDPVKKTASDVAGEIGSLAETIGSPVGSKMMVNYPSSKSGGSKKKKSDPASKSDKMKITSESDPSQPNAQGYFQPGGPPIPAFSPLAYQMFYQQSVAPMLASMSQQMHGIDAQYAKQMNDVMSLPYMKADPVARALLAQVPTNIHSNDILQAAMQAAAVAGPALHQLQQQMGQDTSLLTANLHSYLSQQGANAGLNASGGGIGGLNFGSALAGGVSSGDVSGSMASANAQVQQAIQTIQKAGGKVSGL